MWVLQKLPPSLLEDETHKCSVSMPFRAHLIEKYLEQRALPETVEQFYVLSVLIKQLKLTHLLF